MLPAPVWDITPVAFVYSKPPYVVKEERVVACPFGTVNPPLAVISPVTPSVEPIEVGSRREISPEPESRVMFPVVLPPMVRV